MEVAIIIVVSARHLEADQARFGIDCTSVAGRLDRGSGGGLRLAMPAKSISVAAVVREAEGAIRPAECFDTAPGACRIARVCRMRGALGEAVHAFYGVLEQYTLEDLVADRRPLAKILFTNTKAARGNA